MLTALIVPWRAKTPQNGRVVFDSFEEAVERKVEVEARLLAIGDDVQTCLNLVVDSGNDGVILHFTNLGFAELRKMLRGEFEPRREWIASDHGCTQGSLLHQESLALLAMDRRSNGGEQR
jgi:hypothetical protein